LVRRRPQRDRAALAISRGVHQHPLARRRSPERDPVGQMLDGIDRLAVMTDQYAEVLADELGTDLLLVLADRNRRLHRGGIGDPFQHEPDALGRLLAVDGRQIASHPLPPAARALLSLARRWRRRARLGPRPRPCARGFWL